MGAIAARLSVIVAAVMLAACAAPAAPSVSKEEAMRYVALGDSYTIGTSVGVAERWPDQLVARLGDALALTANIGVNGYTSQDLIDDELPELAALRPDLVSLLIGVNDVVQGVPEPTYAANVATILDALRAVVPSSRIICVATPDYTVTPQGAAYGDPARQYGGIVRVNALLAAACNTRGIRFVAEPFAISRRVATDPTLVAADGLHPSGAQYRLWVDAIEPVVRDLLS